MKKVAFFLFALTLLALTSCQKNEEYIPEPYQCQCGDYSWNGASYQLLDANYIQTDEFNDLSRRYYITADIKGENEERPHSVNLIIEIENVEEGIFDLDEDTFEFSAVAQEVNQNDELLPVREYVPVSGRVRVTPAFFGGTETVQFNLLMRELVNDDLVGVQFGFTGNFTVNVTY